MGKGLLWDLMVRVIAIIAGLLLIGLILRLIGGILKPVLPASLMADLSAGWNHLYSMVAPAVAAIMALVIMAAICWIIMGRRR